MHGASDSSRSTTRSTAPARQRQSRSLRVAGTSMRASQVDRTGHSDSRYAAPPSAGNQAELAAEPRVVYEHRLTVHPCGSGSLTRSPTGRSPAIPPASACSTPRRGPLRGGCASDPDAAQPSGALAVPYLQQAERARQRSQRDLVARFENSRSPSGVDLTVSSRRFALR